MFPPWLKSIKYILTSTQAIGIDQTYTEDVDQIRLKSLYQKQSTGASFSFVALAINIIVTKRPILGDFIAIVGILGLIIFNCIRLYYSMIFIKKKQFDRKSEYTLSFIFLFIGFFWGLLPAYLGSTSREIVDLLVYLTPIAILLGFVASSSGSLIAMYSFYISGNLAYTIFLLMFDKIAIIEFILMNIVFSSFVIKVGFGNYKQYLLGLLHTKKLEGKLELKDLLENERMQIFRQTQLASVGITAAGIAHEINNPLSIIQGHCEYIMNIQKKENVLNEKYKKSFEKIFKTIDRIQKIIQGLKLLSRDGQNIEKENHKIKDILDDIIPLVERRYYVSGINLDVKIDEMAKETKVSINKIQIGQVLLNLLNNAYDAIVDLDNSWVEINVLKINQKILVQVIDSGTNIPPEIRDKMMTPFFTTKEVGHGTGLGLNLCQSLIRKNNGKFYLADNTANTTFVLEFPMEA